MFGYVIPNQAALDDEAKARYRTAYCGLCRRIGALHGLRGRLTLSYDLTFLNLLLSSLYEGESECITGSGHCPIHPIRKINWRHSGPTDYCADMSVALHYYNAADKWNDDHSLLGLGFEKLLDSPAQTVAQRWSRQCNAIRTCLDRLAQLEAEGSEDLDAPVIRGTPLGVARLISGGEVIAEVPLVADADVPRDDFPAHWRRIWENWLMVENAPVTNGM